MNKNPNNPNYWALRELVFTRIREFFREPEAIFWVYFFPVLLAVGLGLAFRNNPQSIVHVGILPSEHSTEALDLLQENLGFQSELVSSDEGHTKLASGRLDILVEVRKTQEKIQEKKQNHYVFDPTRTASRVARERVDTALQKAAGRVDPLKVTEEEITEPGSRYIDFLLPGLMGLNLMGGGIYGVGFVIVDMRVRKLLKRFLATPMRRRDFFLAILTSRIFFIIPEMLSLLAVATLGFGMPIRGSIFAIAFVVFMSAMCFAGLGLLVGTRARKIETISGLINLVMLPMWLLSGIFFSTERFPDIMQPIIQVLPLTAAINALRGIILEGTSLWSQSGELLILLCWAAVGFLLSFKLFRWV